MKQELSKKSDLNGEGIKVGIVIAKFNFEIGKKLLDATLNELKQLKTEHVKIVTVPGALEVPIATQKLIKNNDFDVIIALGVVIKGETDHYEHVSRETTHALTQLALNLEIPIIQGIITAPNKELAMERINRGKEYARSAIHITHTLHET